MKILFKKQIKNVLEYQNGSKLIKDSNSFISDQIILINNIYIYNVGLLRLATGIFRFNSLAGGMAVARPNGFEIDFVRYPFSGSAA